MSERKYKQSPTRIMFEKKIIDLQEEMRVRCNERVEAMKKRHRKKIVALGYEHRKEITRTKHEAIKQARKLDLRKLKIFRGSVERKLSKRRKKRAVASVYNRKLQYIPIVFSFTAFTTFVRDNDITPTQMCFLILLNAMEKITPRGMGKFGFPNPVRARFILQQLEKKQMVSKYWQGRYVYFSITLKGRNLVNKYKSYYQKAKVVLIESEEYARHGGANWG